MQNKIKNSFKLLICFFFSFTVFGQPQKPIVNDPNLFTNSELTNILKQIEKAPILHPDCISNKCEEVIKYHKAIYGLYSELSIYSVYLVRYQEQYRDTWINYVNQTIANENLRAEMEYTLAWKTALADFSAYFLDLSNLYSSIKSGKHIDPSVVSSLLKRYYKNLKDLYDTIAKIDETVKKFADLPKVNNNLTEYIETWKSVSSVLKNGLKILKDGITLYQSLDRPQGLSPADLLKERRGRITNIGTAIASLLQIYAKYERKQMQDAIDDLKKVLKANEDMQTHTYSKHVYLSGLINHLEDAELALTKRKAGLYVINYRCNKNNFELEKLDDYQMSFAKGLAVHKAVIENIMSTFKDSYSLIAPCKERQYQFIVLDGAGKRYESYIKIIRKKDGKALYEQPTYIRGQSAEFTLLPDFYTLEIYEGTGSDAARVSALTINDFEIEGNEESEITLRPFGRVDLEVVDKSGKSSIFDYKFVNDENQIIQRGLTTDKVLIDLPVNQVINLNISHGLYGEKKKDVFVSPDHINKLRFVYEDKKFVNSEVPNLSGTWIATNAYCGDENSQIAIKINHRGNYITAKKISESLKKDCVPYGYNYFEGEVKMAEGKIKHSAVSVGHLNSDGTFIKSDKLSIGKIDSNYKIINEIKIEVGGLTYHRVFE
ncbi:hypothetical protein [Wocania ichthyoenteri]|uniref:hypothetical protein n=1 Tax=Wocania ichthyoenteri TaxID=1230531 RepID=UPI00053D1108|nr:hypothetical protein [Wocania ichthyoenteri]